VRRQGTGGRPRVAAGYDGHDNHRRSGVGHPTAGSRHHPHQDRQAETTQRHRLAHQPRAGITARPGDLKGGKIHVTMPDLSTNDIARSTRVRVAVEYNGSPIDSGLVTDEPAAGSSTGAGS
jgi:hypothetical protein